MTRISVLSSSSAIICLLGLAGCTGFREIGPAANVPGQPESVKTNVLEGGATALQQDAPTDELNIYLVGFHPMKDDPSHQYEAHHFCKQVNEDFMQCVLYDGNASNANLNGLEYIISERLFENLPEEEKQYWHPHNGEILSGQLVAPGLPEAADHALMKSKMNSYGKTWHTWDTSHSGGPGESLPLGKPRLAWSFNRFGEAKPGLIESRDRRMDINTEERRRARRDLIKEANPQAGVDALKGQFEGPTQAIPGVKAKATPAITEREKEPELMPHTQKTIIVQPGDTLSGIAQRIYGDPNKWRRIYRANQQKISNPDSITVGSELTIPLENKKEMDSSEDNRRHKR